MWEIEFYETESGKKVILDFLESLPVKHRARAIREIELLEEFGTDLKMPHVKQIDGKLWELRIKIKIMPQAEFERMLGELTAEQKVYAIYFRIF